MNPFDMKRNKRGQAIIELAVMLPLFLAIVLGAIEYSNMFMTSLRASNLSRQVANAAFRDCAFLSDAAMADCLTTVTSRVAEDAALLLTDFAARGRVIATAYVRDTGMAPQVRLAATSANGGGAYASRYDRNSVDAGLINQHDRIVIGELFYPYTAITPFAQVLPIVNVRDQLYEVTIY